MRKAIINGVTNQRKRVTVKRFLDAIEENGFEITQHAVMRNGFGDTISPEWGGVVTQGCAFGQGAMNLGLNPNDLATSAIRVQERRKDPRSLYSIVYLMNDEERLSPKQIAENIRRNYPELLNVRLSGRVMNMEIVNE